uniref:ATP synthase Fo subunit 8 n=1 Tax=Caridina gracilirostris TaxID=382070 RepID=A0A3Q8M812_9EUCA|nr:ATP synthase Fo subunit 8 [Caridina gracilirostris]
MAPLLWLNLFIFFTATYVVFLILNYFLMVPGTSQASTKVGSPNKFNWKW